MPQCNAQNRQCPKCKHRYWTELPVTEQCYCPVCDKNKNFLNYPESLVLQGLKYLKIHSYLPKEYQNVIIADMIYNGNNVQEIFDNLSTYEFKKETRWDEWKINPYAYKKDSLSYKIQLVFNN